MQRTVVPTSGQRPVSATAVVRPPFLSVGSQSLAELKEAVRQITLVGLFRARIGFMNAGVLCCAAGGHPEQRPESEGSHPTRRAPAAGRPMAPVTTNDEGDSMLKMRVADQRALAQWLNSPQPAVFQDLDLTALGQVSQSSLIDCSILGCLMSPQLAQLATAAGCVVIPRIAGLPFDPFSTTLYTPQELFDKYDPTVGLPSYHLCSSAQNASQ